MNMGVTGPHYTIGAACAAGNAGLIQAAQMLQLGEVDFAIAGGVSESIHTFGIFAGFKNQGARGHHADPNKVGWDTPDSWVLGGKTVCIPVERNSTIMPADLLRNFFVAAGAETI